MREKIILVCEKCLSRNYQTTKRSKEMKERFVVKKFCNRCNEHTVHKESR